MGVNPEDWKDQDCSRPWAELLVSPPAPPPPLSLPAPLLLAGFSALSGVDAARWVSRTAPLGSASEWVFSCG